jgi:hypothetical protein
MMSDYFVTHELKTLPEHFANAKSKLKPFEIRRDDRGFKVGDKVILREWDQSYGYSGEQLKGWIRYVTKFHQKDGYVVFSWS